MSGGFEYTDDEFENFARSSEARKAQFAQLHGELESGTQANGTPFGRMPWSGSLASAYDNARNEVLQMTDSAAEVMQTIADNIRATREHYDAAEVENEAEIEKLGDE